MDFTAVQKNLTQLGYTVTCFDTAAEAADYLADAIHGKSVGFGGSVTLQEMNLYEKLQADNEVFWHWKLQEGQTAQEAREKAHTADVYISSVNGLAESGEMINIDGNCNRVAAIFYGHEKVYLVVGQNKLQPDYEQALYHARNVAAPRNAQRLKLNTPCAAKGDKCYDCKSHARICRGLSVLWARPMNCEYEVILIHEDLGY